MMTVGDVEKANMWRLVSRLFPIYRSILGPGVAEVLATIQEELPLAIRTYPTGLSCGSWTIPQEWEVEDAYVATLSGDRVIDWKENGLHLWLYSRPFEGRVSRDELMGHLKSRPDLPDAVPVGITFYQERWGFSVSQRQLETLTDPEYVVCVKTRLFDGVLRIGEAILPGESSEEILLDSYICHPLLANDNQSGIAIAVELFKLLARLPKRHYTYRLVLCPETIGPAVYLHQNAAVRQNVVGGYTFVCTGDHGPVHYRRSYTGTSVTDRAMEHALRHAGLPYVSEPFDVKPGTTGNEKAYNAPGFMVPVGSLRRSQIGAYAEHCTSADDLTYLQPDALLETLRVSWLAIQALERDRCYRPTYVGEPFLTHYGLFPHGSTKEERYPWDYLKAFIDGRNTLIDVADKAGLFVMAFDEAVAAFQSKGLIERKR